VDPGGPGGLAVTPAAQSRGFFAGVLEELGSTREPVVNPFLALVSYVGVGIPLRLWLTLRRGDPRTPTVTIGGVHIHHEVPGVGLLLASGALALDNQLPHGRAVAFGCGAVLVLDEALLLIDPMPTTIGTPRTSSPWPAASLSSWPTSS
jgi:hypothetical protein